MKFLVIAAALVGLSAGRQIYDATVAAASSDGYGQQQQQQQQQGYGQVQQKCTPFFETETRQQCEDYTERVCSTTHQERCQDNPVKSCTAQVTGKGGRKCFDVEERQCQLREEVTVKQIQVPVMVQKCRKEMERVCDTSYEVNSAGAMARQCVNVAKPYCKNVQKTLQDRICRTVTDFECDKSLPDMKAAAAEPQQGYGQQQQPQSGYGGQGGAPSGGSSSSSGYGAAPANEYSTTTGYGEQKASCRRSQSTQCQDIPRTVTMRDCQQRTERVCKELNMREPTLQAKQNCREVPKRVCELMERQQTKNVKVFSYKQECRKAPRKVCADGESQSLQPVCGEVSNRVCSYAPKEHCDDEPKQHCFQVQRRIQRQRCEAVRAAPTYGPGPTPAAQQGYGGGSDGGNSGY